MKHFLIRTFMCLLIGFHFQDGTAEEKTIGLSCPTRPSNDFRGAPGIPGVEKVIGKIKKSLAVNRKTWAKKGDN